MRVGLAEFFLGALAVTNGGVLVELEMLLMMLGSAVVMVGMVVVLFSLTYIRKIKVDLGKSVIDCYGQTSIDGKQFAIMKHDVRSLKEDIEVSWKEQAGKEVTCVIQELAEPLRGLYVSIYAQRSEAEGSLSCTLPSGAYVIEFKSTDNQPRKVDCEIKVTEHKPLKEYLPIGLTLLTIGTVLAVNGLTIFVRG